MNYEELLAENIRLSEIITKLTHELEQLRKLIYGSRKERFVPVQVDALQGNLFAEEPVQAAAPVERQDISYSRKTPQKHQGRNEIPSHLPIHEVIIEPQEDTTDCVKIGEEVTETLEYTPATLVKRITRRPKYKKSGEKIIIGELPSRPIDKCIAESSLLAHICVSKFVDHLPFYRQIQIFKRDYAWELPPSTINDWYAGVCALLKPLYDVMKTKVLQSHYIQADESPIKVLDSDKPGQTHQGYQWVYRCVSNGIVLFDYRKGRSIQGPAEFLKTYQGYIQTDGYNVYDAIVKNRPQIHHLGCLAHVRRKYIEAQSNDKKRADHALMSIGQIYEHERLSKGYTAEQRKEYRLQYVQPIMLQLKEWVQTEAIKVLPKSAIGTALAYHQGQMNKILAILENGEFEPDNNMIENKIRPLALGRKNYLFAGSHQSAQHMAMMYTFFGTCKAHAINPRDWLQITLDKINSTKLSELHTLIPGFSNM